MAACPHLDQVGNVALRTPGRCEEYLKSSGRWVQLRLCLASRPGATLQARTRPPDVVEKYPG